MAFNKIAVIAVHESELVVTEYKSSWPPCPPASRGRYDFLLCPYPSVCPLYIAISSWNQRPHCLKASRGRDPAPFSGARRRT